MGCQVKQKVHCRQKPKPKHLACPYSRSIINGYWITLLPCQPYGFCLTFSQTKINLKFLYCLYLVSFFHDDFPLLKKQSNQFSIVRLFDNGFFLNLCWNNNFYLACYLTKQVNLCKQYKC